MKHPMSSKETVLILVKKSLNNSNTSLHGFHSAEELHGSKWHLGFFSVCRNAPVSTNSSGQPALTVLVTKRKWLITQREHSVRHWPQIPASLDVAWNEREKVLLLDGSFSMKNPEEIRLLVTAFFKQSSSRISLRCPQILTHVRKCSD